MIIEALHDILVATPSVAAIVGDRVYPSIMPDAPLYPLLVLTKATSLGQYDLQGDAGVVAERIQVDCWVDTGSAAVIALRTAVRRRLSGFKGGPDSNSPCMIQGVFCINDFDLPVPATERAGPKVRRRTLEFNVWSKEI